MSDRVLVVGAGPAGLAMSAALARERVAHELVDRDGVVGGAYREIDPSLVLASPRWFAALTRDTPVEGQGEYVTAGEYLTYLQRFAREKRVDVTRAALVSLAPEARGWSASLSADERVARQRYAAVVIATGMWSTPRWPEIDGARGPSDAVEHSQRFRGARAGERVLVIGAGTSAVEVAERACRDGATVTVSARSGRVTTVPKSLFGHDLHEFSTVLERVPRWMAKGLCRDRKTVFGTDQGFEAMVRARRVRVRGPVRAIEAGRARFVDGAVEPVDRVVCATGFRYATPFAPRGMATMDRARELPATSDEGESASHGGLFFLGFPCAIGVSSEFLRGVAKDAPVVARAVRERVSRSTR
ncbi:MAG: NAD(P)-binding domain-containing protein [Myxococcales bacterium]|nr:NAD(P)-binding domain-containing protein [Myxococcales bacterium]